MTVYVHCGWWDIVKGCVCVWLHRLCVRMYLWVCISLPLVFLTSKTVTSSENSRIFSPVMIQNYIKSLLEKEYSVLITAATGSSIITRRVWKSLTPNPWDSSSQILYMKFLSASPVVIFKCLLSGFPIRAHQKEREGSSTRKGRRVLTRLSHLSRLRHRLSKTYLLWPHGERHIWCFFMNTFHYLGKGCMDEPVQQKKKKTLFCISAISGNTE